MKTSFPNPTREIFRGCDKFPQRLHGHLPFHERMLFVSWKQPETLKSVTCSTVHFPSLWVGFVTKGQNDCTGHGLHFLNQILFNFSLLTIWILFLFFSMSPMYPASDESNIDFTFYDNLSLKFCPDLLFWTSPSSKVSTTNAGTYVCRLREAKLMRDQLAVWKWR